ncbi:hypothetical protein AGR6A_Lc90316 [Agrobacterium sp. NCPPB 925]|nr:hypothetical protein AGR6A_Lc90316 [Agrobacterium sp. NCPPB 925]
MVLRLKTRESRSLPGLQNATSNLLITLFGPADTKGRYKRPFVVLRHKTKANAQCVPYRR